MSLCDVIYHVCIQFGELAFDFASRVAPLLVKCFNLTNEEQLNSIFSLIGKSDSWETPYLKDVLTPRIIECLLSVISILRVHTEPHASEIVSRAITIVKYILN